MVKPIKEKNQKPLDERENVYEFNPDDFSKLTDRVLLRNDVVYRKEPPSNRHRGLTPMMIAILKINHRARRVAEKKGKEYVGLTLYDCQKVFVFCGISNDTVRDNIRRLVKMRFLKQDIMKRKGGGKSFKMAYYSINDDRFPCKDGLWFIGETGNNFGSKLFGFHCNSYPFCSCLPKDCEIVEDLTDLRNLLTDNYLDTRNKRKKKGFIQIDPDETDKFLNILRKKIKKWDEEQKYREYLIENMVDIIKVPDHPESYFDDIIEEEKIYFANEIIIAKRVGKEKAVIEAIRKEIIQKKSIDCKKKK